MKHFQRNENKSLAMSHIGIVHRVQVHLQLIEILIQVLFLLSLSSLVDTLVCFFQGFGLLTSTHYLVDVVVWHSIFLTFL